MYDGLLFIELYSLVLLLITTFVLISANSNSMSDSLRVRSPIHRAQSFKVETVSNRCDISLICCT